MVFQQYHLWPHKTVMVNLIEAPMKVTGMAKKMAIDKTNYLLNQLQLFDKALYTPAHCPVASSKGTPLPER